MLSNKEIGQILVALDKVSDRFAYHSQALFVAEIWDKIVAQDGEYAFTDNERLLILQLQERYL